MFNIFGLYFLLSNSSLYSSLSLNFWWVKFPLLIWAMSFLNKEFLWIMIKIQPCANFYCLLSLWLWEVDWILPQMYSLLLHYRCYLNRHAQEEFYSINWWKSCCFWDSQRCHIFYSSVGSSWFLTLSSLNVMLLTWVLELFCNNKIRQLLFQY